jgi:hypothetical protein
VRWSGCRTNSTRANTSTSDHRSASSFPAAKAGRQRHNEQRFEPITGERREQTLGPLRTKRPSFGPGQTRRLRGLGDVTGHQVQAFSLAERRSEQTVHLDDGGRRELAAQRADEPLNVARRQPVKAPRKR